MDELAKVIAEKAGLPADKATAVASVVLEFLKQKLPTGIGGQLEEFLAANAGQAGDVVSSIAGKIGGMLGK